MIGIALLFCGRYLFKKGQYYKEEHKKDKHANYDLYSLFCMAGALFMFFISIFMIVDQTFDIATCVTFPEKMIFQELQIIYKSCK